jgi:hypothetical protein
MPKFETLSHNELVSTKVRLSRTFASKQNWKHEEYEDLPSLSYTYAENDKRYIGKEEELRLFRNSFWERMNEHSVTYQNLYEREMYSAVQDAITQLQIKWEKTLASDLEATFKE